MKHRSKTITHSVTRHSDGGKTEHHSTHTEDSVHPDAPPIENDAETMPVAQSNTQILAHNHPRLHGHTET
jgi:hypothetical protein